MYKRQVVTLDADQIAQITADIAANIQDGANGIDGADGVNGQDGAQGPQGEQGVQGETGAQGPQGEVGLQGPQGEQGEQGIQGETGAQGEQGADGADGTDGQDAPTLVSIDLDNLEATLSDGTIVPITWTGTTVVDPATNTVPVWAQGLDLTEGTASSTTLATDTFNGISTDITDLIAIGNNLLSTFGVDISTLGSTVYYTEPLASTAATACNGTYYSCLLYTSPSPRD